MRITNHAPTRVTYKTSWNLPAGLLLIRADREREIAPKADGALLARVRAVTPGLHVITADVGFAGRELKQWAVAMVRVR